MNKASRRGTWAALSSRYYLDDKIIQVGVQAEVIYVRSLAFCAASATDGWLSVGQTSALCRGVRGQRRAIVALTSAGLWEHDAQRGGYRVVNWLKWNYATEAISAGRGRRPAPSRTPAEKHPPGAETSIGIDTLRSQKGTPDREEIDRRVKGDGRSPSGPDRPSPPPDLSALRAKLAGPRNRGGKNGNVPDGK